jgi:hypothetical protein
MMKKKLDEKSVGRHGNKRFSTYRMDQVEIAQALIE